MDEGRWILNDEHWEQTQREDHNRGHDVAAHTDTLAGQDASGAVAVNVTPAGDVVSVQLASGWKDIIEPHSLNAGVLSAANAATAQALTKKMEGFDPEDTPSNVADRAGAPTSAEDGGDESRITAEDAIRLVDAVTADLQDFIHQVSAITDELAHAESSGGHVAASGRGGQITAVEVDQKWAGSARDTEIESEIVDVLAKIQERSSLGELANGPRSGNIAEITSLVGDPQKLMRRVGLMNTQPPNEQGW